jgi:uncharacterized protein
MKRNWLLSFTVAIALSMVGLVLVAAMPARAISTSVVIGEFRTRGPSGASDEFVEIYNLSSAPVDISGWKLNGSNSTAFTSTRATVPGSTTLGPYQHYLFANTVYAGTPAANQTYGTGITDDGGLAILDSANNIIDQVGMSAGSAYKEGTTLTPMAGTVNQSYARQPDTLSLAGGHKNGVDTDDNTADFIYNNGSSSPENLGSPTAVTMRDLTASSTASPAPIAFGVVGLTAAVLLLRRRLARSTSN